MSKLSAVIKYKDSKVSIHNSEVESVSKTFTSGFYEVYPTREGLNITQTELNEIHEPYLTEENKLILNTVSAFFKKDIRKRVNDLGFTHKLGILLYGKQGTAKSSLMNYIADQMVKKIGAIVFMCDNSDYLSGAFSLSDMIRGVQDTPIVFIADEFERYAERNEAECKIMLDGHRSIDNSLFLAATNYIDKVPNTLKDRPSRFRVCTEIKGITDKNMMRGILKNMSSKVNPVVLTNQEIEKLIENKSEATLDELKHMILNKVTDSFVKVKENKIGFKKDTTEKKKIKEGITRDHINEAVEFIFNDEVIDDPFVSFTMNFDEMNKAIEESESFKPSNI